MKAAIQSLPRKKAADVYGFTAELLQALDPTWLAPILCQLFHEIIQHGFPQTWNINRVVPIYKAGDSALTSNYRTIMISTIFVKLLAKVVEQRLVSWMEDKGCRARGQARFQPHYSCIDHLVTLWLLIYADNLLLLATLWLEIQCQLDALAQFCNSMGLVVNMSKTKAMVFGLDTMSKLYYKGVWIEHIEKYKSLEDTIGRQLL
ncbi:hypothetical protein SELMODRAFT_404971 [Selaginella moellendorffii]|uniref:Reverse transcriptase domain-containing protein n=1 Tax=Selaginella moellendorffii TaxID=88036 RepID=D8QXY9_SELML|nr:hypothetical protein SELMODRAFT_404971 [Selaginella moellendorffii]